MWPTRSAGIIIMPDGMTEQTGEKEERLAWTSCRPLFGSDQEDMRAIPEMSGSITME